ncbi:MAG TPA: ubiquinol-cytochrome C chaperone family protein [Devosiaceae bacterium]
MILPFFRKSRLTGPVHAVYNAIVAQSRQPVFYAEWEVPDTLTGRFDMISLHIGLVFRRLRKERGEGRLFTQALFDLFFHDMDRSLREMGVGDLSVPKRIRNMGNIFYGFLGKLSEALDTGDMDALKGALVRNVYGGETPEHLDAMAEYVLALVRELDEQPAPSIMAGEIVFGAPA